MKRIDHKKKFFEKLPFPILITTAVIPNDINSVKLNDYKERRKCILEAVKNWQIIAPNIEIIICDGSNFCLKKYFELSKINTNNIEFLKFQNNENLVRIYGKGFGESEIIRYALENSITLRNYSHFAKCTGKLWIKNFHKIIYSFNNEPYLFRPYFAFSIYKKFKIDHIDTRFYIINKQLYINNFLNIYSGAEPGKSIENLFLEKIQQLKLKNIFFKIYIIISGTSGASGKLYNTKFYRVIKDSIKYYFWKKMASFYRPYLDLNK